MIRKIQVAQINEQKLFAGISTKKLPQLKIKYILNLVFIKVNCTAMCLSLCFPSTWCLNTKIFNVYIFQTDKVSRGSINQIINNSNGSKEARGLK